MTTFVQFTAALDSLPVFVVPSHVVYVRVTRPGAEGDAGAQGTLIVTTGTSPDNRVVVSETLDVVIRTLSRPFQGATTSTAPDGPNIRNSSGTWSWDVADPNNPGDYFLFLNGVYKDIGRFMQLIDDTLYTNTTTYGWWVYNTATGEFEKADNPNSR